MTVENNPMDGRIEEITGGPGEWFVYLKAGYAYSDANSDSAAHCFGDDTKAAIRKSMKLVRPCACSACRAALGGYQVRFIKPDDAGEIVQLYHTARAALSDKPFPQQSPHHRMLWASAQFHKAHPEVSETGAYKDLCGLLGR